MCPPASYGKMDRDGYLSSLTSIGCCFGPDQSVPKIDGDDCSHKLRESGWVWDAGTKQRLSYGFLRLQEKSRIRPQPSFRGDLKVILVWDNLFLVIFHQVATWIERFWTLKSGFWEDIGFFLKSQEGVNRLPRSPRVVSLVISAEFMRTTPN